MSSQRDAERVLKQMEASREPSVNHFRLRELGNVLQTETREAWPVQRVKKEFLVPLIRKIMNGASQLEAESEVWKELGVVDQTQHRRELNSRRDIYGRKKVKR